MKRRIAEFKLEEVTEFIKQAAISSRKKYFSEQAWGTWMALKNRSPEEFSRSWQAQVHRRDCRRWCASGEAGVAQRNDRHGSKQRGVSLDNDLKRRYVVKLS
jgi:hypothetical protein